MAKHAKIKGLITEPLADTHHKLPSGTTAQRPPDNQVGYIRMNTSTGSLEFNDGTNWVQTNLIPHITSITGNIVVATASNLVFAVTNNTDTVDVDYYEGGVLHATTADVAVSGGAFTTAVPAAVYGQTAGDTITIKIKNVDNTPSDNTIDKTVLGLPTGGAVNDTVVSGSRIHTITASGDFVVPTATTIDAEWLIIAGGGGGGDSDTTAGNDSYHSGGGAGGLRTSYGSASGGGGSVEANMTLTAGTYAVVIGAGGARNTQGGTSSFITTSGASYSITTVGGGRGQHRGSTSTGVGGAGGSGGGGANYDPAYEGPSTGGAGTSNQGYPGGTGHQSGSAGGNGGGGAGTNDAENGSRGGNYASKGGTGLTSDISGTSDVYATGGHGRNNNNQGTSGYFAAANAADGQGDGGTGEYTGGDGVVIIRYVFPPA